MEDGDQERKQVKAPPAPEEMAAAAAAGDGGNVGDAAVLGGGKTVFFLLGTSSMISKLTGEGEAAAGVKKKALQFSPINSDF